MLVNIAVLGIFITIFEKCEENFQRGGILNLVLRVPARKNKIISPKVPTTYFLFFEQISSPSEGFPPMINNYLNNNIHRYYYMSNAYTLWE